MVTLHCEDARHFEGDDEPYLGNTVTSIDGTKWEWIHHAPLWCGMHQNINEKAFGNHNYRNGKLGRLEHTQRDCKEAFICTPSLSGPYLVSFPRESYGLPKFLPVPGQMLVSACRLLRTLFCNFLLKDYSTPYVLIASRAAP